MRETLKVLADRFIQHAYDRGWRNAKSGAVFDPYHDYSQDEHDAYRQGFTDARK